MKVIEKLRKTDKTLFSFELLPPVKGGRIGQVYRIIDSLIEFDPMMINITYHQQEVVYKNAEEGDLVKKKVVRKRPGTVAISAAVMNKYHVDVVPHIICGGFTVEETEDALIDLHYLGIHNILVLRGDPPKGYRRFIPEKGGHKYASDLVRQVERMNHGIYLDENLANASPTDFCVGVAGYPEKHCEAPNMETDLQHLREKVDAGADYVVTQMFFDNRKYFRFVERCRKEGIDVPIVPGLKPVTFRRDIELLPRTFSVEIPEALTRRISKCKTDEETRDAGIEWTVGQSMELKKAGVPAIHYYTISIPDNIRQIARQVF